MFRIIHVRVGAMLNHGECGGLGCMHTSRSEIRDQAGVCTLCTRPAIEANLEGPADLLLSLFMFSSTTCLKHLTEISFCLGSWQKTRASKFPCCFVL